MPVCLAMDLVSSRNIEEMVFVLKNEVEKTHNLAEHEDTGKYRQLLVRTLHTCSIKVSYCLIKLVIMFFLLILCFIVSRYSCNSNPRTH